jgi:hypothetical protein
MIGKAYALFTFFSDTLSLKKSIYNLKPGYPSLCAQIIPIKQIMCYTKSISITFIKYASKTALKAEFIIHPNISTR